MSETAAITSAFNAAASAFVETLGRFPVDAPEDGSETAYSAWVWGRFTKSLERDETSFLNTPFASDYPETDALKRLLGAIAIRECRNAPELSDSAETLLEWLSTPSAATFSEAQAHAQALWPAVWRFFMLSHLQEGGYLQG